VFLDVLSSKRDVLDSFRDCHNAPMTMFCVLSHGSRTVLLDHIKPDMIYNYLAATDNIHKQQGQIEASALS
jgi:hypothetical protein